MTYTRDTLFKALDGATSPVARYKYPVGRWTEHLDPFTLWPCQVGYHLARGPEVLQHLDSALYVAEPCPEHGLAERYGQLLTCRVRLSGRIARWNERTARLFAADVAEAVLLGERLCDKEPDERSWAGVDVARAYADGLISDDELAAAEDAARNARREAIGSVRWRAAWGTARVTARVASDAAVAVAAWAVDIARNAAQNPTDDVLDAATDAADAALYDRLVLYLNDEPLPPVEPLYGPAAEKTAS